MICKKINSDQLYNYKFIEDGKVELENQYEVFSITYEEWCMGFYVIDKWNSIIK